MRASLYGLGTAVCFASSTIFVRRGLEGLPSPLLGVTIGMIVAVLGYGFLLLLGRRVPQSTSIPLKTLFFQVLAGIFVGLGVWARYIAIGLSPVAVVLALLRISVPLVLLLSPLLIGRKEENVTGRLWLGSVLIVVGSLVLIFCA